MSIFRAWVLICIGMGCSLYSLSARHTTVMVFIHGTVHPEVQIIFNMRELWQDGFNQKTLSANVLDGIRRQRADYKSELMYDNGLHRVDSAHWKQGIDCSCHTMALYYIIGSLDATFTVREQAELDSSRGDRVYCTFGWSGLLSSTERKQAGKNLCEALLQEYDRMNLGPQDTVSFELFGHSYGGHVVLYCGTEMALRRAARLCSINLAVLSAVPLHKELIGALLLTDIKRIVNMYSGGDAVQPADIFSSKSHRRAVRTFKALFASGMPIELHSLPIIDLQWKCYGDKRFFGHNAFHAIHQYPVPLLRSSRTLQARLAKLITPLPLLTLYPYLLERLPCEAGCHHYSIDFIVPQEGVIEGSLYTTEGTEPFCVIRIPESFHMLRGKALAYYERSRYLTEFDKCMNGFKAAYKLLVS